jgi:hypothetical protein
MTLPSKPRSTKKWALLTALQTVVVIVFVVSAAYCASQVPKVISAVRYYQSVGSKQTDKKLDDASDTASRIEEELIQALRSGALSPTDFQARYEQLVNAESNRARALENYSPAQ